MRLIENYIAAVGARLHASRRSAVEAELRASIMDALEARDASVDSEADIVEVLRQLGSPERVAAEYEPQRGYLVGPELYPHMRYAAACGLALILVGGAIFYGTGLLLGDLGEFRAGTLLAQTLGMVLRALIIGMVVLVIVFAWAQRSSLRLPIRSKAAPWDPRSLAGRTPAPPAPRAQSAVALVVSAVILLLLDGVGRTARDVGTDAASEWQSLASDVAGAVLVLQVALLLAFTAHVTVLVTGRWFAWSRVLQLLADGIALVVFVRVAFQLLAYRDTFRDAGASDNAVNWLIINAFIIGGIFLTVVAVQWARIWRSGWSGASPHAAIAAA